VAIASIAILGSEPHATHNNSLLPDISGNIQAPPSVIGYWASGLRRPRGKHHNLSNLRNVIISFSI
jgi:hypothetical protein